MFLFFFPLFRLEQARVKRCLECYPKRIIVIRHGEVNMT